MNTTTTMDGRLADHGKVGSLPTFVKRLWDWLVGRLPMRQRKEKLERLMVRYRTLPTKVRTSEENKEARQIIEEIASRSRKRSVPWSAIEAVDRALLTMLPGEDLRCFARTLRAEFKSATGAVPADEMLWKSYQESKPPEACGPDETKLRADLLSVQAQLQELRANRRIQIRARNGIALWTVVLFGFAAYVTLQLDKILGLQNTIVFDVVGVGMLGGLFSTLLRVQRFKLGGVRETDALSEAGNRVTVMLSPAIGGAGAVVLFVLLAAGFLKGAFFPELAQIDFVKGEDYLEDLFTVRLASSAEAAKLYFLCFLAGFSERLVPDVMARLDALAAKQQA